MSKTSEVPPELLARFLVAENKADVEMALTLLKKTVPVSILPIGGRPETSWFKNTDQPNGGTDWNNRNRVRLIRDPDVGLVERIRNGDDSIIELFQQKELFKSPQPKTYAEAAQQVADTITRKKLPPPVTLIVSEDANDVRTATVCDVGLGIPAELFSTTIMITGSQHKVNNPLVAGNMGIGGQPSVGFCDHAVIVSRLESDPNQIAFVVTAMLPGQSGEKGVSYVYYCTPQGHAFTVDARKLNLPRFVNPQSITNRNCEDSLSKPVMVPHGTIVRLIGYQVGSNTKTWNSLREIMFGVPIPHTLVNGLSRQKRLDEDELDDDDEIGDPKKKRVFHTLGLRATLNRRVGVDRESNPIVHHQPPIEYDLGDEMGSMKIGFWLMDSSTKGKKAVTPVRSLLGNATNEPSGIMVTLDGQKHANFPDKRLLEDANLPYLDGHLMIEVILDALPWSVRNDWIHAQREHIEEVANITIKRYLKIALNDNDLKLWNKKFKDRYVAEMAPDQSKIIEQLNHHFALTGIDHSVFGGGHNPNVIDLGQRKKPKQREDDDSDEIERKPRAPFEPKDPPTFLEIRKSKIEPGGDEWLSVRTDAADHFDGRIRLEVQNILGNRYLKVRGSRSQPQTHKGLRKGRDSFLLHCSKDCPIGTQMNVRAVLTLDDGGSVMRSKVISIEAVVRPRDSGKQKQFVEIDSSQPNIVAQPTAPGEPSWMLMKAEDVDDSRVAFNYIGGENEEIRCYYNTEFGPYLVMLQQLEARKYDATVLDMFTDAYKTACVAQTMADLTIDVNEWEAKARHGHRTASIITQLVLWHMQVLPTFDPKAKAKTGGKRAA